MDRVINWSESVRLHFGDVTLPELLPAWNDLKLHLPVGSKVSGPVVLKAPFGVWLDLGVRFPAMLLITRFKDRFTYDNYVEHGPQPGDHLDAIVYLFNDVDRQLVLTQNPLEETA